MAPGAKHVDVHGSGVQVRRGASEHDSAKSTSCCTLSVLSPVDSGGDIMKQLPQEAKRFQLIDRNFMKASCAK